MFIIDGECTLRRYIHAEQGSVIYVAVKENLKKHPMILNLEIMYSTFSHTFLAKEVIDSHITSTLVRKYSITMCLKREEHEFFLKSSNSNPVIL